MTAIGPPHLGQSQRGSGSWAREVSASICDETVPSAAKHSGRSVERRRLARKILSPGSGASIICPRLTVSMLQFPSWFAQHSRVHAQRCRAHRFCRFPAQPLSRKSSSNGWVCVASPLAGLPRAKHHLHRKPTPNGHGGRVCSDLISLPPLALQTYRGNSKLLSSA